VPLELAAVCSLVPEVIACTSLIIITCAIARGSSLNKNWDKTMFVVAAVSCSILCAFFVRHVPSRVVHPGVAVLAVTGLLVGIATVERHALTHEFWEGFGTSVALASAGGALVIWAVLERSRSSRALRRTLTAGVIFVCLGDLASLVRTLNYFAETSGNVYVLNEILAPAAGRVPDATFLPQYVALYGWALVPLKHLLTPWALANLAVVLLSCLSVLAVALAVLIARRALPRGPLWLAAGLVVPLTSVTVLHGAALGSSIGSYLQELPVRLFSAMLFSWIGLGELVRFRNGAARPKVMCLLGVLGGLIAWNSQDLGIAVVVAYTAVLLGAVPLRQGRGTILLWVGGLVLGFALYPLLTLLGGSPVKLQYFALLSRTYEGGLGAALVQVPGPVLVVLPLLLASTAVGWCVLLCQRKRPPLCGPSGDYAVLTLALVGTWSTVGFLYYLNRSYASGQLQLLLMPCGVCLAGLVSLCLEARTMSPAGHRSAWRRIIPDEVRTSLLPISLLVSLAFATVLQSPGPRRTIENITRPPASAGFWAQLTTLDSVRTAQAYVHRQGGSLGYFGENGSYITLVTGVPTLLLTDTSSLAGSSPVLREDTCKYLQDHETRWLVSSETARLYFGSEICGLYRPISVPGLPTGSLSARM